jgi:hypothetical protein
MVPSIFDFGGREWEPQPLRSTFTLERDKDGGNKDLGHSAEQSGSHLKTQWDWPLTRLTIRAPVAAEKYRPCNPR